MSNVMLYPKIKGQYASQVPGRHYGGGEEASGDAQRSGYL
jgi:hypothetical protein